MRTSEQQTAAAQKLLERLDGLIARLTGVIPPLVRASRAAGAAECSRIGGSGDAGLWEMRGGNGKRARTVITPPTPAGEKQSRYSPRAAIARTRKRSYARDRRELFVSNKTASVHVSRILTKLSVPNRTAAAAVAQHLGVTPSHTGSATQSAP